MTNEELRQEVKRLEEQIKDLKIKLEEKAERQPYEVEVPEDIGDYYYVDADGLIESLFGHSGETQKEIYKRGLAFKTRAEAEQFDKERILLFKLHKWADWRNGDWHPDLNNGDDKFSIYYFYNLESFSIYSDWNCNSFNKLPYFKSEELVREFIKEFGEEIKEVLL